jgi:N6-adenosine-specific RNA methylase IME4/ParB-like chromosome segregation protein Spo0J
MAASSNEPSPEPTRSPASLQPHPEADAVPLMDEREYEAFRADIAAEGIHVPIEITREDVVLDGRQRLRAAIELGLMHVPVRVVAVGDELEYMLTAALLRRQLSPSQRAALVVELQRYRARRAESKQRQLSNLRQASEGATLPPRGKSREFGAQIAGVSARTMQDAITVHEHDRQLFERVKRGEVSAPLAARRVRRRLRDGALPRAGPMPGGLYEVICADPPWQMGNPDGPLAPEKHYPTMPLEEIKALEPRAADNSVLFLWAVTCLLPQALEVIAAWGFEHKSCLVWVKPSIGPGVWVRNRHELLLIATKGSFSPPDPEDRVDSVIEAPRGRHSEKPACVYELIERMYPHASKLELFARRRRPGWAVWGNEVPA